MTKANLADRDPTCYYAQLKGENYEYGIYERINWQTSATKKALGTAESYEEGLRLAKEKHSRTEGTVYDSPRAKCYCEDRGVGEEAENYACFDIA